MLCLNGVVYVMIVVGLCYMYLVGMVIGWCLSDVDYSVSVSVVIVIVMLIYGRFMSDMFELIVILLSYVLVVLLRLNVFWFSVDVRFGVLFVWLMIMICSGGMIVNVRMFYMKIVVSVVNGRCIVFVNSVRMMLISVSVVISDGICC